MKRGQVAHRPSSQMRRFTKLERWRRCTLIAKRSCLHGKAKKKHSVKKLKLRSRDYNFTNYEHACEEGSVKVMEVCYGEIAIKS